MLLQPFADLDDWLLGKQWVVVCPGIDQLVPLEEMKRAGHGHSTGAQIKLTDRFSAEG